MVLVDPFTATLPLSVLPGSNILRSSLGICVNALPMSGVIVPFSLIGITVDIAVLSMTISQVISPVALVLGAVRIDKLSQSVFLVLHVVA